MFYSQAGQDKFVVESLNYNENGYFLEIGSAHYDEHNNSYYLEKELNWNGIMIEYDNNYLKDYIKYRPNSIHVINDAQKIDYIKLLELNKVPNIIDYLQIDLDVHNRSTLNVLEKFDKTIFHEYKFATVTFEHDSYRGNFFNTKELSRSIFKKHGYLLVYPDVSVDHKKTTYGSFEDWYIHPDLVDINRLPKELIYENSGGWKGFAIKK